jgi:uncharacterized protein YndB with AHSA1/START domain
MTEAITIAPVRKRIRVAASQAHAFDVFTRGISGWWPRNHNLGSTPLKTVTIEPHEGGLWYHEGEDGTRIRNGRVKLWDPPNRFVVSWDINHHWKADETVGSEVEVAFIPDGPSATIVNLEHRNFEILGAEGGESMRRDVDRGWPGILDLYRQQVEQS